MQAAALVEPDLQVGAVAGDDLHPRDLARPLGHPVDPGLHDAMLREEVEGDLGARLDLRRLELPSELRGQPARNQPALGDRVRAVVDLDFHDLVEEPRHGRRVERLAEDPPPELESPPVQVRDDPPAAVLIPALGPGEPVGRVAHAATAVDPAEAVVDHLLRHIREVVDIRPRERRRLGRAPPEVGGDVADEQATHSERQMIGRLARRPQFDLLEAEVAVVDRPDAYGRLDGSGLPRPVGHEQDDARRVQDEDLREV